MTTHGPMCRQIKTASGLICDCSLIAEVGEEIAQAIEAEREQFMRVTSTDEHHWLSRVFTDCAAIAHRIGGSK